MQTKRLHIGKLVETRNSCFAGAGNSDQLLTRRRFFANAAAVAIATRSLTKCERSWAIHSVTAPTPRYRIGVCDWMMLKRQKLGAFPLAKEVDADGVEVDMGSLGQRETFDNALADAAVRQQFLASAKENSQQICSLAMSGFYAQSFAERPTVPRMLSDCIATTQAMDVKAAFLPLGVRSDLIKYPQLRPVVVERLKAIAPAAEKAGVVIGIETSLDATEEVRLLNDIGSSAIRSYFNFANALQAKRDLYGELRILGREQICQIHCTDEDGVWLQNNSRIDMQRVKSTLDDMGWSGWLVVERSRDAHDSRNVRRNFGANVRFLKSIFQKS